MKELPSKDLLDAAIKAGEEIKDLEAAIMARGHGIRRIVLDDGMAVYSGVFKSGQVRLIAGERPIGEYPCRERVAIWNDVKDLIN